MERENGSEPSNKDVSGSKRRPWWPILLFVLGLLLYLLVYWYQSGSVTRDASFQYHEVISLSDGPDLLTLHLTYPRTLLVDQTRAASQTVTLALWYDVPPQRTQPYTISLTLPLTTVVVTDGSGNHILPRFVVTPTVGMASPVTFNLRRALLPQNDLPQVVPVLRLQSASGAEPAVPQERFAPIALQSHRSARWMRFWSLVLEPTTPLLAAGAGLVALAVEEVRRWQKEQAESRQKAERHRQKIEAALAEIRSWEATFQSDASNSARRYTDYLTRPDPMWQEEAVKAALQKAWMEKASVELDHAVELLDHLADVERFYVVAERIGVSNSVAALEWVIECLDDEWQQQAFDGISLLGRRPQYRRHIGGAVLQNIERRPWCAVLRIWPHLSVWCDFAPSVDPELVKGVRYLGLSGSPFGPGQAEIDNLLPRCRVAPPWLEDLHQARQTLLVGGVGSGKTATALLMVYDSLQRRDAFPVYYPAAPGDLQMDDLASVLTHTLIHYLAVTPSGFLKQRVAGRAAIAHLLARYAPTNLSLRLHQAGLPSTGDGAEMLKEIEYLTQDNSFEEPLPGDELLALLSEARPRGFQYTIILLDVQEQAGGDDEGASSDKYLESLLELSDKLARIGLFVKAFLTDTFRERLRQQSDRLTVALDWSEDDLSELLENRLKQFGDDTLAAWCDPREGELSPDDRLVSAAEGTPGGLIHKGNELLQRIGQTGRRLRARDLDDVLGPQPDEDEVD